MLITTMKAYFNYYETGMNTDIQSNSGTQIF